MTFDFSKISFNAGLLVKELIKRRVHVSYVGNTLIVIAAFGSHEELLFDTFNSLISYPEGWIINDKFYTKQYLKINNIPVNDGNVHALSKTTEILETAESIGYPVVVKPTIGSHGDDVYLDIQNESDLIDILRNREYRIQGDGHVIVEKYFPSNEYRIFVTKNNFFAVVHRIPASVLGDEVLSVAQLVVKENYRRMNPRRTCLCEIPMNALTISFLSRQGLSVNDIPPKNKRILLRQNSNVSTGGNCIDVTDEAHTTIKKIAFRLLHTFPHASYLGIDVLCDDISKHVTRDSYRVCELNSAPGLSLHMMPEKGKSRDAAGALADMLFPETTQV